MKSELNNNEQRTSSLINNSSNILLEKLEKHKVTLIAFIRSKVKSRQIQQNILEECYTEYVETMSKIESLHPAQQRAYILVIAKNKIIDAQSND